jgi:hypothetical protein
LTAGAEEVTGTADNDMIEGASSGLASVRTLDAADVIDGGEGIDTLKVEMNSDFNGFTTNTGSMSNVEILDLTNASSLSRTFDASNASDIATIKIDANDQNMTVKDLDAVDQSVEVSNADAAKTVEVAYAANVTDGTSDSISYTLNDVGSAKTSTVAQKDLTLKSEGIENVNVESAGTANFITTGNATNVNKTMTATGSADLSIAAVDTTLTELDASAMTGALTADLAGATVTDVSGGTGDDTVTVQDESPLKS